MPTVTISLPESLKSFIEDQLQTKGYGNVSEYFRTLLRDAQQQDEDSRLERLLIEGLASGGKDIAVNKRFWSDLKTEALQMAKERRASKKNK